MTLTRALALVALLLGAVVLQTAVAAQLGLPAAVPNLTLLVVVGVAITLGADAGALTGFGGGLLLALVPAASEPVGVSALVLTVVGYAVGTALGGEDLSRTRIALVSAVAGAAAMGANIVIVGLLVGPALDPLGAVAAMAAQAVYCAALGALLVPGVSLLLESTPVRW